VTHNPLAGASFKVEKANGESLGTYRTDAAGKILIPEIAEGTYVVSETAAPDGYILSSIPQNVNVNGGKLVSVEFLNKPLSGIEIVKIDAVTRRPLQGASFGVTKADGTRIGTYKTEADGKALISGLDEGVYVVGEVTAPDGYQLDETPKNVTVKSGKPATAEFANKPFSGIEIRKVDAVSGNPLAGAAFNVTKQNGEYVSEITTDSGGRASIASVEPGWYVITEIKAPTGYIIDSAAKTVEVKSGAPTVATFSNKPLSGIEILKFDSVSKAPLMGATFAVERDNGEKIGSYNTDAAGKIIISALTEGTYIVSETAAPDGYILDAQPQTVVVKSGKLTSVEFANKPLAGLQISKLDSVTRQPIANTEFAVAKMSGERVGAFKTDTAGTVFIAALEPGRYVVTETKAADGYIIDSEPKNAEITTGKSTTLEVLNTPRSGLLIVKTDASTRKPLAGVKFEVKKPSGEQIGIFTTDISGQIRLADAPAGKLIVAETQALDGYELDTQAREVTIHAGKQTTLEVTNTQKAGFRLLKIDSVTKKGIYNVEFMLFDSDNKQVGTYRTDNNGMIDFGGILSDGRYTIRETRPAEGYYSDDTPRTVEFKSGKVTEIVWENTPQAGQIQITKLSGDDNEQNGLPKGSPLPGAVFEVYAYKSGNLVDRFTSGADGRAVSKPLPLGRYAVKEVQAPQWYRPSAEPLDIEIEFATQIIRREFSNYSANTGVKIKKVGNYEAMPGDTIKYDFKEIANTSAVPLTDFFWRDIIPTDAVRLNRIVTGTYSQSLKYKILATTNKGDTMIVTDNLSTTQNNVIDCRNANLGLAADEYVTGFTLVFGTVKAGFCKVDTPSVYVTVNKNLPNGYEFANKSDIGGRAFGTEWVVGNSTWLTKTYAQPVKMPRTGY
jgi:uncharacterized surface anchored protein